MPPLIFRKGLDLKDAVAGQLAESYHSELVARIKDGGYRYAAGRLTVHLATRVRLLLRRRSRGRLRVPGAQAVSGSHGVPHRRNHPQPARQRQAARARHPLPERSGRERRRAHAGRRRDPAGVRRHDRDARRISSARLHAGRHDVRLGAQRLEERPALRAGRLHRRSSTASTGTRRRRPRRRRRVRPGGRYLVVTTSRSGAGLRLHPPPAAIVEAVPRDVSRTRCRPASIPTSTSRTSASPTRRRC